MSRAALLSVIAALLCVACTSCTPSDDSQTKLSRTEQSTEATPPAETASDDHAELFAAWRQQPKNGHDRRMAIEMADGGYLVGMSFGEVTEAPGPFDGSGIPLQTISPGEEPPGVTGGIVYAIESGCTLEISFVDGVATSATYRGLRSEAELDLSGVWLTGGNIRLEKLELQAGGGLIRWIRPAPEAPLKKGFGNWWMLEPGKLVFYDMNFDEPDVASVYLYDLSGDNLELTWIDEAIDPVSSHFEGRDPVSGQWIAGEPQATLSLMRP